MQPGAIETPMPILKVGVIRYASAARAIAEAIGTEKPPDVAVEQRITVTFRQTGGTRWAEQEQVEFALHTAAVARQVLTEEKRLKLRDYVNRAIVVVLEDVTVARGCAVTARWDMVVPPRE